MVKKILITVLMLVSVTFAQVLDAHYIQPDDYFISDRPLEGHSWIRINVAKMIEAPGPNTNGEAKFLVVKDGKELWTKNYWQSYIASESEIKLGAIAIMFDYASGSIYIPPKHRDDARTHNWFMAKITDTSTTYKGHVLVSGGYNVSTKNIRLIGAPELKTVDVAQASPKPSVTETIVKGPVKAIEQPVAAPSSGGLRIVKAMYGDFLEDNSKDVKDILNAKVKDGQINITCSDAYLGVNFRTANEKSLKIEYETKDGVFETVIIQGMSAKLPNKSHRKVKR